MRRIWFYGAAIALACSATAGCTLTQPLNVATGMTAKTLCSEHFIAGRDPDVVFRETILPTGSMHLVSGLLHYQVDEAGRAVSASVLGGFAHRAVFTPGRGCTAGAGGPLDPVAFPAVTGAPELPRAIDSRLNAILSHIVRDTAGRVGLCADGIVWAVGHGPGDDRVRCRRHPDRRNGHLCYGPGLRTVRAAIPGRWCRCRKAHSTAGLARRFLFRRRRLWAEHRDRAI